MNKKQIIVLWIGIAVIVLMGLFPPWHYKIEFDIFQGQVGLGYRYILTPPQLSDVNTKYVNTGDILQSIINTRRLFIQWVMVAVITGGLLITLKDKKEG